MPLSKVDLFVVVTAVAAGPMMKKLSILGVAGFWIVQGVAIVPAQSKTANPQCPGKIYAGSEVSRRAKITQKPDLGILKKVTRGVHGRIVVDSVLCRNGRLTDVHVVQGLNPTVDDFFSQALGLVGFIPAEMNFHSVSQRFRFEFDVDDGVVKEIIPPPPAGRLVERIEVMGFRRFTSKQILSWIQTRAGDPFNEAQVKHDFEEVLATRYFDKLSSRVFTEDGVRGGVNVYFELVELPVVGDIKFEGLRIDRTAVMQALKRIDLQTGEPYTADAGKAAIRLIRQALDANAQPYSRVELREEMVTSQTVNLTFVISN